MVLRGLLVLQLGIPMVLKMLLVLQSGIPVVLMVLGRQLVLRLGIPAVLKVLLVLLLEIPMVLLVLGWQSCFPRGRVINASSGQDNKNKLVILELIKTSATTIRLISPTTVSVEVRVGPNDFAHHRVGGNETQPNA